MLKIYITLKSFELHYIEKNVSFLKKLYLILNKTPTNNRSLKNNINRESRTVNMELNPRPQTAEYIYGMKTNIQIMQVAKDYLSKNSSLKTSAKLVDLPSENITQQLNVQQQQQTEFINRNSTKQVESLQQHYTKHKKIDFFREITFPKKKKLFTVLRSPHVDKKSREQFHFTTHTKKLCIQCKNIKYVVIFLFILKNAELYGVETEIAFRYNSLFHDIKQAGSII